MQSNTLASESIALHMICTTHGCVCVGGGNAFLSTEMSIRLAADRKRPLWPMNGLLLPA